MHVFRLTGSHTREYLERIPTVLKWFEEYELKFSNTRYTKYLNYINEFEESKDKSFNSSKFYQANEALQECIQIVEIFEKFKYEKSIGFVERLQKVLNGRDLIEDDDSSVNDFARDFLYELTVAVYLKKKGYAINFDGSNDVIAYKGNNTFIIECKKLKSEKSLEDNFKKAGKQLAKVKNSDNIYGLIFIDIYNCISKKIKLFDYDSILEMNTSIEKVTDDFYKNNSNYIEQLNERFLNNSLGVCFTSFKILWLSNHTLQYYKNVNVKVSKSLEEKNYDMLTNLMGYFKE